MFRWSLFCSSLCPVPLALSLATSKKNLDPSSDYSRPMLHKMLGSHPCPSPYTAHIATAYCIYVHV